MLVFISIKLRNLKAYISPLFNSLCWLLIYWLLNTKKKVEIIEEEVKKKVKNFEEEVKKKNYGFKGK